MQTNVPLMFLTLALAAPMAGAQSYDLQSDWSDLANPNGTWTLREGNNALPAVTWWQHTFCGGDGGFSAPTGGWARSEDNTNRIPYWFKSRGVESGTSCGAPLTQFWQTGDVLVHTQDDANGVGNGPAEVIWTAPAAGRINIVGGVWMGRNIGRSNTWTLFHNGVSLTSGSISSGDVYDRGNPFSFANGSGGAIPLQHLVVAVGDTIELHLVRSSTYGDFVGVNFTVSYACGSADFNCDGDLGTDADIESFFACLSGNCPAAPCASTADFNGDGDLGTDADIEAFFRVLAGGSC